MAEQINMGWLKDKDEQKFAPRTLTTQVQTPEGESLDKALEKLAQGGGSGIHIGTEAPTDKNVNVWIDTDEEAEGEPSSIDVTAEVGQTIIVKAVDENGKPTEWEAVDFPNCGQEILAPLTYACSYDDGFQAYTYHGDLTFALERNKDYTVLYDGVAYKCRAYEASFEGFPMVALGNKVLIGETTTEPFFIASALAFGMLFIVSFDENEHTISISKHQADNSQFRVQTTTAGDLSYTITTPPEAILEAFYSKRPVVIEYRLNGWNYLVPVLGYSRLKSDVLAIYTFYGYADSYRVDVQMLVDPSTFEWSSMMDVTHVG